MPFKRECSQSSGLKEISIAIVVLALNLSACGTSEIQQNGNPSIKSATLEKVGDDCAAVSESSAPTQNIDSAYQKAIEGDYDGALEAINPIIAKNPHNFAALKIRAECNYAKKQYSSAIADLTEVIKADPQPGSYFLRAQIYQSDNQLALAENDFAKVVALDLRKVMKKSDQAPPLKTRIIHMIYLANSMEKQSKYSEAVQLYTQILSLEKDEQNALHCRSRNLVKLGKHQAALSDLNHLNRLCVNDARLKLERAECLLLLGKNSQASDDLKQAQALKPELAEQINNIRTKYRVP